MSMSPSLRKLALTMHITFSVSWLGTVAAFLVLAIVGLASLDPRLVRAVSVAAQIITWMAIVPLAFASLLSGIIMSLGTEWGLFRHYWVLAKLLINVLATILLLIHTRPVGVLAGLARTDSPSVSSTFAHRLQVQLLADASVAVLALLVATVLAVYKPRGVTRYGWRKLQEKRRAI